MSSLLQLSLHIEEWQMKIPFRITGHLWDTNKVVVVELSDGKDTGRGEGMPVYYLNESVESIYRGIGSVAGEIERGIDREALLNLMAPGGARNAVDCALWDLEAKKSGKNIWDLTGIEPKSVFTAFTIGIEDTPEAMADRAQGASIYPILKVKVDNDRPVERLAAIRAVRPDAELRVDANQAWAFEQLVDVSPKLAELGVTLIEQPLPRGKDQALESFRSSIPLCADESCQNREELAEACERYQVINIKLDKAGGLTEALFLAQAARKQGLELYVGNMGGTSLSMAPAFVLAQLCKYVELDGPLLLNHDRFPALRCEHGEVAVPDPRFWG
jgi:L-Ala-D/L-Glu epimerase